MKSFPDKHPDGRLTYSMAFDRYLVDGVTISSFDMLIEVATDTQVPDPGFVAANMYDSGAALNSTPKTITERQGESVTVPANSTVMRAIKAGVDGCAYRLLFKPVLSNGDKPVIERRLLVTRNA